VFPAILPSSTRKPAVAAALALAFTSLLRAEPVDFSRDVLPILSTNCFKCHGRDISTRKAKLRLDQPEFATIPAKDGLTPIVPGHVDQSELIARITSTDDDERMPPADKGRALTAAEQDVLKRWIAEGAAYTEHWAFLPPKKSLPPKVKDATWAQTPIDRFILAALEKERLHPAPAASPETLIRRATLDLTGLPPTPAEVEAFIADRSPDAYAKAVNRLLNSPHYGERYGRHWLDVARYADSGGFETDLFFGHAWRYRDYVIRAFNRDKPFDRFIKEQVAGDELYPDDQDARIATGFYTIGPVLQEAGMVTGKLEYDQLTDAVDTTGAAFVGLTFACARCHDHKYDPVSQKEYYRLQAVFAASDQADYSVDGKKLRDRAALKTTLKEFEAEQARLRAQRESDPTRRADLLRKAGDAYIEADPVLKNHVDSTRHYNAVERAIERYYRAAKPDDASDVLAEEEGDTNEVIALKASLKGVAADRPAEKIDAALLNVGIVTLLNPVNIFMRGGGENGARAGAVGTEVQRRRAARLAAANGQAPAPVPAAVATAELEKSDRNPAPRENGAPAEPLPKPAVEIPRPMALPTLAELTPAQLATMNGFRIRRVFDSLTTDSAKRDFLIMLGRAQIDRPKPEGYVDDLDNVRLHMGEQHMEDVSALPMRVLDHRAKPLETHLLRRGELSMAAEVVDAGVPEKIADGVTFADIPPERRRSVFAEWIASDKNVLTARVIVNRVWAWHFGEGLVRTPNDLGLRGDHPTHPELLDWLAVEFVEHGWSIKYLNRLIMLSRAYRMSETVDETTLARDPDNRLLTHYQPHRLEAEAIWDSIRAVAGTLDLTMFGLPIAPPLDDQEQLGNYRKWPTSTPAESNRRAIYILTRRSFRFPMLSAFDLPDNITSCGRRDITTVPNQALTLLNNRTMRDQATAFATRLLSEAKGQLNAVPALAWRYVYGRSIAADERKQALAFLEHRKATTLSANDAKSTVSELCLALFNTNEFIYQP
jgi:hypothetical protein